MLYRTLMAIALLVALFVLFFAFLDLGLGGVDREKLRLWLPLAAAAIAIPVAAAKLRAEGHNAASVVLLLIPAIPALLFALFMLAITISPVRWN